MSDMDKQVWRTLAQKDKTRYESALITDNRPIPKPWKQFTKKTGDCARRGTKPLSGFFFFMKCRRDQMY